MPKVHAASDDGAELAAALAVGDKHRALGLLMARHGEGVYRYAMAMTHDRSLAEEVRQQVFVEAFRDLGDLASPSSLPHWIFGIARHRCLDAVNDRTKWNQRFKNEPPEDPEPYDGDPDRELDRSRLARILERCLAKLAPAARDAVILRYHQELSYDEAAARAGERPGTLQRRVARALSVLRRCVEANRYAGES